MFITLSIHLLYIECVQVPYLLREQHQLFLWVEGGKGIFIYLTDHIKAS